MQKKISKKLIKFNYCSGNNPKYIVIHNTDNPTANAENHYRYWNSGEKKSSAHYVVDDKEIIQLVEHKNQSYHNGKKYVSNPKVGKCNNSNSIGIEICNAKQIDFDKSMENTIWLVKKLMKELNIPVENVITHKDSCGKQCPSTILSMGKWGWFKEQLVEKEENWKEKATREFCEEHGLDTKLWVEKASNNEKIEVGELFAILNKIKL